MKFLDSRLRGNDTRGMYTWPLWISEFFFISDCAQLLKGIIINAKRQWEMTQEKKRKEVSVLFLDLEGYTKLSSIRPDTEVNEVIEKMFSSFVDPIHRSHGDINETSGDALMIIFKDHDARTNAINAVKAAFEIAERNRVISA